MTSPFITGYSLRAPNTNNVNEFYHALENQQDLTSNSRRYPSGYLNLPRRTGTLPEVAVFDNEFFKYSVNQTDKMDIIIRLLLEVTHEALMDAKIPIASLRGSRTGVYIGHCFSDYLKRQTGSDVEKTGYELVNSAHAMAANKISFFYDLQGPSIVFDTACSSSLVALHQAYQDLTLGLIDRAIVGGASLTLDPNNNAIFQAFSMLSPDGRCYSFDSRANGYCRSEGIAVVILESAESCGGAGYAKLRGTSVNCDGYTSKGITFPSAEAQARNALSAFAAANKDLKENESPIATKHIGFIEAHGTGTIAGDSQELQGLLDVFYPNNLHDENDYLARRRIPLGSVKSVMGHAEAASGLMSLIKVLLMYEHKVILPNQNFRLEVNKTKEEEEAREEESSALSRSLDNPHRAIRDGYFQVFTQTVHWKPEPACISNYGFGGTNAFAIIEPGHLEIASDIILGNDRSLKDCALEIDSADSFSFGSLPDSFADEEWFREQVEIGNDELFPFKGNKRCSRQYLKIAFVFSGQGSQWNGMGSTLMHTSASFRNTIERLDIVARSIDSSINLIDWFIGSSSDMSKFEVGITNSYGWMQKERSGVGITSYQIGLINILREYKISPDYVIGHSLGEVAAAYACGLYSECQTIEIAIARCKLAQKIVPGMFILKASKPIPKETLGKQNNIRPMNADLLGGYGKESSGKECSVSGDYVHDIKFHYYYVDSPESLPSEYMRVENGDRIFDLSGSMVAIGLDSSSIQAAIDKLGLIQTSIACYNSPQGHTVSGATSEIFRLKEYLQRCNSDLFWREIPTDNIAYHAPHLHCHFDSLTNQFAKILGSNYSTPIPNSFLVTSIYPVQGLTESGNQDQLFMDKYFHARNIVNPVFFQQAIERLPENALVVEIGPHQSLLGQIRKIRGDIGLLGLVKQNDEKTETYISSALRLKRLLWSAGYNKHMINRIPCGANESNVISSSKGSRLSLSRRFPNLWNHSREQKTFNYTDYELFTNGTDLNLATSPNNISSTMKISYDISGEHSFLLDHVIQGQPLFPAVGHLYSLWLMNGLDKDIAVSDLEILRPVPVEVSGGTEPNIITFYVINVEFEFWITHKDLIVARATVKVTGISNCDSNGDSPDVQMLSDNEIMATNSFLDNTAIYNNFARYGYEYCKEFRLLRYRTLPYETFTGSIGYAVINPAAHIIAWLDAALQLFLKDVGILKLPTLLRHVQLHPSLLLSSKEAAGTIVYIDDASSRLYNKYFMFQDLHTLPTTRARKPCQLIHLYQTFVPLGLHSVQDDYTFRCIEEAANWMACQLVRYFEIYPYIIKTKPWLNHVLRHAATRCKQRMPIMTTIDHLSENPLGAMALHAYSDIGLLLANPLRCISFAPAHDIFYSRDDNGAFVTPLGILEKCLLLVTQEWLHNTDNGLRVLEGGVGTGGLTRRVWPVLTASHSLVSLEKYLGFDISAIDPGKDIYSDRRFNSMHHDLNNPLPTTIEDGEFHLFCSSNAIHTAKDIVASLHYICSKIVEGGYLLLEEFIDSDFCLYLWGLDSSIWMANADGDINRDIQSRSFGLWMTFEEWQQVISKVPYLEVILGFRSPVRLTLLLRVRRNKDAFNSLENKYSWIDLNPIGNPAHRFISPGALSLFRTLGKEYLNCNFHTVTIESTSDALLENLQVNLVTCPLRHLAIHNQQIGVWLSTSLSEVQIKHLQVPDILGKALTLSILQPGDISTLEWRLLPLNASPKSPQKTLIQVEFASLNFKDVMYAYGKLRLESSCFGMEAAGFRILKGIDDCDTVSTKQVMGIGCRNCIATFASLDLYWEVPAAWSLADAATVPVAYLTALFAMAFKSKMRRGQTMLVHGGAGAVGHAAISLAQRWGIEVFTTCSEHKRKHLKSWFGLDDSHIGNSRDVSFVNLVLQGTNGKGVDVIINCLSGAQLNASLTLVKDFGHFCEIGKYDLQTNTHIGLKVFERNVSYHAIDLAAMFLHRDYSKVLHDLLKQALDSGDVRPIPHEIYQSNEVANALRYLSGGKHVGKVIIDMRDAINQNIKQEPDRLCYSKNLRPYFSTSGTHIITGGLGGFGMELAFWLVDCGAHRIILTSRSGKLNSGWQRMRYSSLINHAEGVEIVISTDNVAELTQCSHLLDQYKDDLRGIWHSAMVLDDMMFSRQTEQAWNLVHQAKTVGFLNLDIVTRSLGLCLDSFVLFSSVVALQGNIGQAAYSHANASAESIIHQRNADGLCGVAIQWGAIANVGYVAQNAQLVSTKYELQSIDDSIDSLHYSTGLRGVISAFIEPESRQLPDKKSSGIGIATLDDIKLKVASVLGGSAADYDEDLPIQTYGLDSLSTMVLVNWINNQLRINASSRSQITSSFFENESMTLRKLYEYVTVTTLISDQQQSETCQQPQP